MGADCRVPGYLGGLPLEVPLVEEVQGVPGDLVHVDLGLLLDTSRSVEAANASERTSCRCGTSWGDGVRLVEVLGLAGPGCL